MKPSDVPFLLVDGRDILASIVTSFEDDGHAETEETTGLGPVHGEWKSSRATGIKGGAFAHTGLFDDAAHGVHMALNEQQGIERLVCYGVAGGTIGSVVTALAGAFGGKYKRSLSTKGLHKAACEYTVTGSKDESVILHDKDLEVGDTWDTEATSVDNGASSAGGGSAQLHVTELDLDGATGAVVKVRHSADNVTFADLITFATVTEAPASERKTVAGTVNRYLATAGSYTGTGGDPEIVPVVVFARAA